MPSRISQELEHQIGKEGSFPRIYTVGEITRDIQTVIEAAFDAVWIEGEISNYREAASGHAYFILKDQNAQIRCVLFRQQNIE